MAWVKHLTLDVRAKLFNKGLRLLINWESFLQISSLERPVTLPFLNGTLRRSEWKRSSRRLIESGLD